MSTLLVAAYDQLDNLFEDWKLVSVDGEVGISSSSLDVIRKEFDIRSEKSIIMFLNIEDASGNFKQRMMEISNNELVIKYWSNGKSYIEPINGRKDNVNDIYLWLLSHPELKQCPPPDEYIETKTIEFKDVRGFSKLSADFDILKNYKAPYGLEKIKMQDDDYCTIIINGKEINDMTVIHLAILTNNPSLVKKVRSMIKSDYDMLEYNNFAHIHNMKESISNLLEN